jgi:predicted HTH domain antitoxin
MAQTMTITVPDEIFSAAKMSAHEMAAGMLKEFAVKLFREGTLTLVQSAHLCGLNIYDFLDVLAEAGAPVIAYDPAELDRELSYFSQT